MMTCMLGRKSLPNKAKIRRNKCMKTVTTGVIGIGHGLNMNQKERELMDANFVNN